MTMDEGDVISGGDDLSGDLSTDKIASNSQDHPAIQSLSSGQESNELSDNQNTKSAPESGWTLGYGSYQILWTEGDLYPKTIDVLQNDKDGSDDEDINDCTDDLAMESDTDADDTTDDETENSE
ncbi:uncharacterized protein LOC127007877 [Eriocheir sinensis]|uniref:uncharacterized protein LOC126991841 n=1 Tax=Eriocheir sinensis TaxID=95602 RepID=UPI0021C87EC0|nr:uncharacterized protein LOC126991789 isoform X2 [Eriocheir sinensis]XP_050706459.1 uncharacterized protein LOC126991841 [Eriocheir sinensis]XP_050708015.1 uncharacterized protein LOC126993197 [Eriocheir sinensis]XP_050710308.1 uncharacterized protein LOC126995060 [Eriocheir sinensis]XP_050735272.1 uncharacterized protein LOC127007877 [Eriocheir sinensis]XP_050735282.1 uncharacterized protein LOC127007877 [Eriocheir sinensis]XP_050735285.1 uncharacterized protein LOC127007877 [Eriocheir sin